MRWFDPHRLIPTLLVLVVALTGLLLGACDEGFSISGERGSGDLVTETRELEPFTSIDAGGAINLDLVVDAAAPQSVTVTYDDNILDNVVTRVSGSTLVIELEGSLNLTGNSNRVVTVTINELESLEASGATDVRVSGTIGSYRLDVSGASSVDARDLVAEDIEVDASGASNADLYATGTVSGSVSGASNLNVYGEPKSVLVDSSGASSVDIKD